MRTHRFFACSSITCFAWLVLAGCSNKTPANYCDDQASCPNGSRCDVFNKVCVDDVDSGLHDSATPNDAKSDVVSSDSDATTVSCTSNDTCPSDKPLCSSGSCQKCSDSTICKTRYAGTKEVCASGACVECKTDDQCASKTATPACVSGACAKCTRNYQCPDSACDADSGQCHDTKNIVYVDSDVDCSGVVKGTSAEPFCTIKQGLDAITGTKDLLFLRKGKGYKSTPATPINIQKSIRIVGARTSAVGAPPVVIGDNVNVTPAMTGNIQVMFEDVQFKGVANRAIQCTGPTMGMDLEEKIRLMLKYVTIDGFNATSVGLNSNRCTVEVTSNTILRNKEVGIQMLQSKFTLLNNIVAQNGTDMGRGAAGIYIEDTIAGSSFLFNTIVDNKGQEDGYNAKCIGMNAPVLKYSIVLGNGAATPVSIKGCVAENSVVPVAGNGNILDFVPAFKNKAQGDYHLIAADSQKLRVTPQGVTIPLYDIDGETRGTSTDIGADHYVAP